jgi:hypothetical protein
MKADVLVMSHARRRITLAFAVAAAALAFVALPAASHAQGIVGGAERGAREGNRAAGPVGGVVGGAVGAGVGGVVGGVKGVLGVPDRSYRKRGGYYDRHGRYHRYRHRR